MIAPPLMLEPTCALYSLKRSGLSLRRPARAAGRFIRFWQRQAMIRQPQARSRLHGHQYFSRAYLGEALLPHVAWRYDLLRLLGNFSSTGQDTARASQEPASRIS